MITKIKLSADKAEKLRILAEWDLSEARALAIREGLSEEHADMVEAEYRKYMGLVLLEVTDGPPILSASVDPFLHAHILCTVDYLRFCTAVFGQFMHHFPVANETEKMALRGRYAATREKLKEVFGEHNEALWADDQMICFCRCQPEDDEEQDFRAASQRAVEEIDFAPVNAAHW